MSLCVSGLDGSSTGQGKASQTVRQREEMGHHMWSSEYSCLSSLALALKRSLTVPATKPTPSHRRHRAYVHVYLRFTHVYLCMFYTCMQHRARIYKRANFFVGLYPRLNANARLWSTERASVPCVVRTRERNENEDGFMIVKQSDTRKLVSPPFFLLTPFLCAPAARVRM